MLKKYIVILLSSCLLFACNYNSSRMLHTDKDYQFDENPEQPKKQIIISPSDQLQFRLYANNGFKLIDITSLTTGTNGNNNLLTNYLTYEVEYDGTAKLPLLGRTILAGKTVREAETYLEKRFAKYYKKPFVLLKIDNKRVIVFPGNGGDAEVVALKNKNTTLLEGLALAGGIANIGKAKRIKLIRGNIKDPKVYYINLSTLQGAKDADFYLQPNDIIYVEPRTDELKKTISTVAPIISLVTSILTLYFILNNTK